MVSIAREILLHDKLRFVITVVSLGFAIVMMVYDVGMFFGVTGDSVNLIDRAQAELWLSEEGESHLNAPSLVPDSALGKARRLDGVHQACALDHSVGNLKIDDTHQVEVIGIDPACPLFQPWEVVEGEVEGLKRKDTIVVDDLALRGINHAGLGDVVELDGREMRIVAITHDNKSFSYPYVYISLQTFKSIAGMPDHYNFCDTGKAGRRSRPDHTAIGKQRFRRRCLQGTRVPAVYDHGPHRPRSGDDLCHRSCRGLGRHAVSLLSPTTIESWTSLTGFCIYPMVCRWKRPFSTPPDAIAGMGF